MIEVISTFSPVKFTDGALIEIKKIITESAGNTYLRIGAKGGGCSGLSYVLEMDEIKDGDHQYEFEGIQFIMNKAHEIYLTGIEVHYESGLQARGFTFKNPNASSTCGCGSSFSI